MTRPAVVLDFERGARPGPSWRRLRAACGGGLAGAGFWTAALCDHLPRRTGVWATVAEAGEAVGGLGWLETARGPLRTLEAHHAGVPCDLLLHPDLDPARRRDVLAALLGAWTAAARAPLALAATLHAEGPAADDVAASLAAAGFRRTAVPVAYFPLAQGLEHVEAHLLKKNRRNERNRSLRRGCATAVTSEPAVIDEFLPIYHAASRRWGARPLPAALLRGLLADGGGRVYCTTVRREGVLLGAHLCLEAGGTVTAWVGSTVEDPHDVFPATLLVWADLEEACRRGASRLDLGGHGGQQGVAQFKELLGALTLERAMWRRTSRLAAAALALGRGGRP
ncbi:MAG: GNAT family N-acetyltransferase [bacterium]|nr:GNAT family N-acetyltransferase [bacterium]